MRNTFRWREEAWAPPKRNHNRMVVKGNYGISLASRAVIFLDKRHRLISYQEMFQGIFSVAPGCSRRNATLLLRCGRPIRPYIGVRRMRLTLRSAGTGELEA
jgi:hypothetical protein